MKKILLKILKIFMIVGGLYILICGLLFFFQEKLIFFPQKLQKNYRFSFDQKFEEKTLKQKTKKY
jgi:uncharacterized protein